MTFAKNAILALVLTVALPMALPAAASATGIGHTFFMRGTIVDLSNGVPTICVGRADGAEVGQTLDVVRIANTGEKSPLYRRIAIGKVRIDAIIDDHFASATVVSGKVAKHDIVELRRN